MWDLIVSVPDHCLSFYFVGDYSTFISLEKIVLSSAIRVSFGYATYQPGITYGLTSEYPCRSMPSGFVTLR